MSRRMPPTPVAAPWKGSTAVGWLWLSTLNATASPPPTSTTPAFSPGPCRTRSPADGQAPQEQSRVLVAAMLGPEDREDGELEVVRPPLEQLADSAELPVGETESAMERLPSHDGQGVSLAGRSGCPAREAAAPRRRSISRGGDARRLQHQDEPPRRRHDRRPLAASGGRRSCSSRSPTASSTRPRSCSSGSGSAPPSSSPSRSPGPAAGRWCARRARTGCRSSSSV